MADRIERYLGRLEAELAGRVDGARLEEILVEVEGHLRESEEAYRELGEPTELANRLAVDGFRSKSAKPDAARILGLTILTVLAAVIPILWFWGSWVAESPHVAVGGAGLVAGAVVVLGYGVSRGALRAVGAGFAAGVLILTFAFGQVGRAGVYGDGSVWLGVSIKERILSKGIARMPSDYSSEGDLNLSSAEATKLFGQARRGEALASNKNGWIVVPWQEGFEHFNVSLSKDEAAARTQWLNAGNEYVESRQLEEANIARVREEFEIAETMVWQERIGYLAGSGWRTLLMALVCSIGLVMMGGLFRRISMKAKERMFKWGMVR